MFRFSSSKTPSAVPDRFRHAPSVIGVTQGDATVLLHVDRGTYHTLNEVGGRIWQLIGSGESIPAIVQQLCREYEVPPEVVQADAGVMVERLLAAKLIEAERV